MTLELDYVTEAIVRRNALLIGSGWYYRRRPCIATSSISMRVKFVQFRGRRHMVLPEKELCIIRIDDAPTQHKTVPCRSRPS